MKPGRGAYWALALVALAQAFSMIDRQILAILLPRIKADLHVGDAEMGLLYGSVFAVFYALFSLPLGRLADGWVRTRLLAISITGWSLMTALGGMASSFGLLAVSRLGVGIGEASVQPAGFSLLCDHFPRERRGTVSAVFAAAIAVGIGSALWIGGATADAWDHAYPVAAPLGLKGWQAAFIVAALPGFVLAVLLARLREPVRGAADGLIERSDPAPWRAAWETLSSTLPGFNFASLRRYRAPAATYAVNLAGLGLIVSGIVLLTRWTNGLTRTPKPPLHLGAVTISGNLLQWLVTGFGCYVILNWLQSLKLRDPAAHAVIARTPSLILLFVIAALQSVLNYGIMAFTPSFLIKSFHLSPADVGLHFGILSGGMGIVGPLIAGPVSDWLRARVRAGRIYVLLAALVISPFMAFLVYRAPNAQAFYFDFIFYSLALTMWAPPVYASFMDLVLPRMRGTVISFYILTMTIFGLGIGPYAVGLISDTRGGDLGNAMLSLYWLGPVLVALAVALILRLPRDEPRVLERARAAGERA